MALRERIRNHFCNNINDEVWILQRNNNTVKASFEYFVGKFRETVFKIYFKKKLYDIDPLKMLIKMNCKTTEKKTLNEPPRHKTNALKTAL